MERRDGITGFDERTRRVREVEANEDAARVGGGGGERDEAKTRGDHAAATHRGQAQEDEKERRGVAATTRNIGARLISSPNHSKQRSSLD